MARIKKSNEHLLVIPRKIETLKQFYELMNLTKKVRQTTLQLFLKKQSIDDNLVKTLQTALNRLEEIPCNHARNALVLYEKISLALDLTYELAELKKDICFSQFSFLPFFAYLEELHPGFQEEVKEGRQFLREIQINNWFTDRDGTVNNYCGRYKSSIQSFYNALFLTCFSQKKCAHWAVILTSAPLYGDGLLDVSLIQPGTFIYAGSKGGDFLDMNRVRYQYPVSPGMQARLDRFNEALKILVSEPAYEIFALIGSGLQFKLGQTTIAYQDVSQIIPETKSREFVERVMEIIHHIDERGRYFRVEKTGMDMEIILTIEGEHPSSHPSSHLKEFDKGDGLRFIDKTIGLKLEEGTNLVCGDTIADLAMIEAVKEKSHAVKVIFVTRDEALQRQVKALCPDAYFVTNPDVLVTILYQASTPEGHFD